MIPIHGASIQATYQAFNVSLPDCKIIDFSTNTNCLTLPESIQTDWQTMTKDIESLSHYPASEYGDLLEKLANYHKLKQDQFLITNGTNEAIYLLASCFSGRRIGIIQPTYPEYMRAMLAYDVECVHISWEQVESSLVDLSGLDALVLCNPNNPTGQYMEGKVLGPLLEESKKKHVQVIIDEAYIDFLALSAQEVNRQTRKWIENYSHVIVLRSLTKIFRIPGIRLGYVIGQSTMVERLQKRQPSWSVNRLALMLGQKLMDKVDYIEKSKVYYRQERARITNLLVKQGWEVIPSEVNYFMIKTEEADQLIRWCLKRGLVLRHTKNHYGLDGGYVRIGLQKSEENTLLTQALLEYQQTVER